jgi:8-oxo-dGTP pyrophosphatase MutT (NUDIX family)
MTKIIRKIGLVVVKNKKLLLVKKRGLDKLIMPGGKRRGKESQQQCIIRELKEELNVRVDRTSLKFLGRFEDISAENKNTIVVMELYHGNINGKPQPQQEIEEYMWFAITDNRNLLSPIIKNKIFMYLINKGFLS